MRMSSMHGHGEAHDKFSVKVYTKDIVYATIKIESRNGNDFTYITQYGINLSRDCLVELRDALNDAIDELAQMEKNWELKIDDEKHEAQDKEAE